MSRSDHLIWIRKCFVYLWNKQTLDVRIHKQQQKATAKSNSKKQQQKATEIKSYILDFMNINAGKCAVNQMVEIINSYTFKNDKSKCTCYYEVYSWLK